FQVLPVLPVDDRLRPQIIASQPDAPVAIKAGFGLFRILIEHAGRTEHSVDPAITKTLNTDSGGRVMTLLDHLVKGIVKAPAGVIAEIQELDFVMCAVRRHLQNVGILGHRPAANWEGWRRSKNLRVERPLESLEHLVLR